MLSIIVAVSQNGVIGRDNQLLWKLSADLKHFKNLTTGNTIIMGRKTFESIGKALPNRINIVISKKENYHPTGVEAVFSSLEKAISFAENLQQNQEIFIIGGGEIYAQAMDLVEKIYLTEVKAIFEGDTFFSPPDTKNWKEISRISYKSDEKNEFDYDFVEYLRK